MLPHLDPRLYFLVAFANGAEYLAGYRLFLSIASRLFLDNRLVNDGVLPTFQLLLFVYIFLPYHTVIHNGLQYGMVFILCHNSILV